LVSANGYNIHDITGSAKPAPAEQEHRLWYQYYFHTPRGRAGLEVNRREICRLLWRLWSPNWRFDDATYDRTARSFDNPDFVDVVIHSYRHRYGYADGDPNLDAIERRLAAKPKISVPTIVLHGEGSGLSPAASSQPHAEFFTGPYQRRVIPSAGHNLPQEVPKIFADAVLDLVRATK
jgi:pimeloyl-ACP methyl ester carboxylesterase